MDAAGSGSGGRLYPPLPPFGNSAIAPRPTLPPGVGPTTLFATAGGSGLVLAATLAATRTAGSGLILAATWTTRTGFLLVRFAGTGILSRARHLSHPGEGARTYNPCSRFWTTNRP